MSVDPPDKVDESEQNASPGGGAPPPTDQARTMFGARLELAQRYAVLLAGEGVQHGHLGPREVPRLWERHLVNCAQLTDLVPHGARIVDVGSGAGLPGIPMAVRRPDLEVDLVEPMLRRTRFLTAVVDGLDLGSSVRVVRGRAEEPQVISRVGNVDWVVTRAVAPLDRLVRWCLPLLSPGGSLLALKGASAQDEVGEHHRALTQAGAGSVDVIRLDTVGAAGTWVVRVDRAAGPGQRGQRRGRRTR